MAHSDGSVSGGEPDPRRDRTVDRDVLLRFRSGDPDAVRLLYTRYGGAVFTIGLRALGDRTLAEDVVQQTFVKAWRAAGRFDPDADPGPWLYTIARRVAIDQYRRERRHRADRTELTESAAVDHHPGLESTWDVWQVRSALDRLPDEERQVVRATHYLGMTHGEAAEHLGVPVGTVKSRSWRAYQRLASMLGHLRGV